MTTDSNVISEMARLLRPISTNLTKGKEKLALSTVYLGKLNRALEANGADNSSVSNSFHLTQSRASLQMDIQFLHKLLAETASLKITRDLQDDLEYDREVSVRRFAKLKSLEIVKLNVDTIVGLQKLRSQIEELKCNNCLDRLEDLLERCGGDNSHKFTWGELRRLTLSSNRFTTIDTGCFETTPWLQHLDLSHNELRNLEFVGHLPNLKHLNLAYNRLEKVPQFKGQICKRLQVLLLNNNLLEDIVGLTPLVNLLHLNLAHNCLIDHQALSAIAPMACLLSLDLRRNPLSYHPGHRMLASSHLNKNVATFSLNNQPLTQEEASLVGSFHPLTVTCSLDSNDNHSSRNSLSSLGQEKHRRVRNVIIIEGQEPDSCSSSKANSVTPSPSNNDTGHLDIKRKLEMLHKEYGDKWLSNQSGEMVKQVLNYGELMAHLPPNYPGNLDSFSSLNVGTTEANVDKSIEHQETVSEPDCRVSKTQASQVLPDVIVDLDNTSECAEDDPYISNVETSAIESTSDDEPMDDSGTFLAGTCAGADDLLLIVTEKHLSERDSSTVKAKARWHMNVVKSCRLGDDTFEVRLDFDTPRTDRQSRIYYIQDADTFIRLVEERMREHRVPDRIYQCMKCNSTFSRGKVPSMHDDVEQLHCAKCGSGIVIELKRNQQH